MDEITEEPKHVEMKRVKFHIQDSLDHIDPPLKRIKEKDFDEYIDSIYFPYRGKSIELDACKRTHFFKRLKFPELFSEKIFLADPMNDYPTLSTISEDADIEQILKCLYPKPKQVIKPYDPRESVWDRIIRW